MAAPALRLNTPPPTSTPILLQPIRQCGRAWKSLTNIPQSGTLWKVCQIIIRVIPVVFVALATLFASTLGLGCVFLQDSKELAYKANGSEEATALLRKLEGFPRNRPLPLSETQIKLEHNLRAGIFDSPAPSVERFLDFFTEDVEKERARQIAHIPIYDMWKIDLPVKRSSWPLGLLTDAFRGPISNSFSGDDILDFVLGIDTNFEHLEPEQLEAVRHAVQSAQKIRILGTLHLNKIEVRLQTSPTFY